MANKEITINQETAQLILDALAWMDKKWMDTCELEYDRIELQTVTARAAFTEFCRDRGIKYVEVERNA